MSDHLNDLRQPVGFPVPDWTPREFPPRVAMEGRTCRLEPLDGQAHAAALFAANAEDREGRNWTYLPYGPFADLESYRAWVDEMAAKTDPQFYAIVERATGKAAGVASYLRIDPNNGVIEVGHINYSPRLSKSVAATEAMYLMMRRVFEELGYRRYEWKCNALNAASTRAAERLGLTFEGVFRQMFVVKGRNRDSAWYSILDREWPAAKAGFEAWLDPANFDGGGKQIRSLEECRQG